MSSAYVVWYYLKKQNIIQISFRWLSFHRATLKEIFLLGIPTFFRQVIGSVIIIVINNLLRTHGGTSAISTFGMAQRILMFFMMPLFGVTQGLAPIIGYNYGAQQYYRVQHVLDLTMKILTLF
ncbi:MAG: hypothetical protein LBP53_06585 [Candidatus Peribacteria bacterium]|jgi:Na+-driven multidrug efflux pump|nr:hypothetical protein [Candidatus Peribacteria bacterium]